MTESVYAFDLEAAQEAADRWEQNEEQHAKFVEAVRTNTLSELDTPRRRALRTRRLLGKLQAAAPEAATQAVHEALQLAAVIPNDSPEPLGDLLLERVVGKTADFLFVEFFEQGLFASRSVGRIVTDLGNGRRGFGTGFMVSPRLLLTNHHVLPSSGLAAASVVEFNYQRDRRQQELARRTFRLDPGTFFLNHKKLDFALVAVDPDGDTDGLAAFGWCPLIQEEGKITEGEPIHIVQHPMGELKQVVISENRLVHLLGPHAHYEADTLPGSSGSPVFNKQWEVVALHHSGVPLRDENGVLLRDKDRLPWREGIDPPETLGWVANEGIRVSRLVDAISAAAVKSHEAPLVKELLASVPPAFPEAGTSSVRGVPAPPISENRKDVPMAEASPAGSVTVTVPLQITVSLGTPTAAGALRMDVPGAPDGGGAPRGTPHPGTPESALEKVEPDTRDPGYQNRPGYQSSGFLDFDVPFPQLGDTTDAFSLPGGSGNERYLLKYHHYSLILNKQRKLAFVAGVNYDPTAPVHHPRDKDGDRWYFDPRVSATGAFQAGEAVYAGNPLDRGHLVRRADAGWGATAEEAKLANDDTFHFTNCSPQHEITNRGMTTKAPPGLKLWGSLEDHISSQGKKNKRKLCIFNGPVFGSRDRPYRGVRLPDEFWKVVVFQDDDDRPAAAAFVLTQADLISGLEEKFDLGEYRSVQVRVRDLEERTGLDFGPFVQWDTLKKEGAKESFTVADVPSVVLESLDDVVL